MICKACGYEHETEWVRNNGRSYESTTKGNDKFIEIEGTFLVKHDNGYGPIITREISLYACPKCFTVRVYGD